MSDKDKPTDGNQEDETPEIAPNENHDGTAPTENGNNSSPQHRLKLPVLKRRAEELGISVDKLSEMAFSLTLSLQDKADREEDGAENNKATARARLKNHIQMLFYVLIGGLLFFGASSELVDLSGLNVALNLPEWLLVLLVSAPPISIGIFAWHELGMLRASFIRHHQEKYAYGNYQKEIVEMKPDCPVMFDGSRHESHRPYADAIRKAHPASIKTFRQYRFALVLVTTGVTAILATFAALS